MGKVFAKFVHLFKPSAKGYELLHVALTDQKISNQTWKNYMYKTSSMGGCCNVPSGKNYIL